MYFVLSLLCWPLVVQARFISIPVIRIPARVTVSRWPGVQAVISPIWNLYSSIQPACTIQRQNHFSSRRPCVVREQDCCCPMVNPLCTSSIHGRNWHHVILWHVRSI